MQRCGEPTPTNGNAHEQIGEPRPVNSTWTGKGPFSPPRTEKETKRPSAEGGGEEEGGRGGEGVLSSALSSPEWPV